MRYFTGQGFIVHGALGVEGQPPPAPVRNDGYGSAKPRTPDVVAFDTVRKRVVFGLVRPDKESLSSEESLEEYNVFLDHNHNLGEQASAVFVLLPDLLLQEFTSVITHYVHREYWHRIIPVCAEPQ